MFFDTFEQLCLEKGVSLSRALLDLDMSKSSITRWKEGREPSNSSKKKIADYFGVTVNELISGEISPIKEKAPAEAEAKKINVIKIAGRDGRFVEKHLTDEQLAALKLIIDQLPDADMDYL